jgi:NNP family nitrate/nitrite transporter-like MFS transporter
MAGGWGNLGGGFTYIFMPAVFSMFIAAGVLPTRLPTLAWRVSFIIPAFLCFSTAACMWFLADDASPLPLLAHIHDGAVFIDVKEVRVI